MPSDPPSSDEIFECQQCGDCCKGFGGTYVSPDDIQSIAAYVGVENELFLKRYCMPSGKKHVLAQGGDGYCIFWKDRLCSIHPVKPKMCKAWPYISGVLKDPQNWYIMAGQCPGIRTDVSPSEIVARVGTKIDTSR